MAKSNGLGMALFIDGYDLSGDVGSIQTLRSSRGDLDVTAINKYAHERIGGFRDGEVAFNAWYNPADGDPDPVGSQIALEDLPLTDAIILVCFATLLGSDVAELIGPRVEFNENRTPNGALELTTTARANGHGVNYGDLLTAGRRVDTGAANGTGVDGLAASSFGWTAVLQVLDFDGTDATVKIMDSADDVTYADLAGAAFDEITAAPFSQRLQSSPTATLRRYVRATSITTGGFTLLDFVAAIVRYAAAHAGD